jgi:predicted RNase H-like HicB family nuclease
VVNGGEPSGQRQLAVLEHGASRQPDLLLATVTLEELAALERTEACAAAARACKPFAAHDPTLRLYERDSEAGLLVGIIPGLLGAHTQAETLDALNSNLREVVELLLEEDSSLRIRVSHFVGPQPIEIIWVSRVPALA